MDRVDFLSVAVHIVGSCAVFLLNGILYVREVHVVEKERAVAGSTDVVVVGPVQEVAVEVILPPFYFEFSYWLC